MPLTNEQIDAYLADNGTHCLHCGSEELDWDTRDYEDGEVFQEVTCNNCDKTWLDFYRLSDVEIRDDDGNLIPSTYKPLMWLVTVSNEVGLYFRAIADSQAKAYKALAEWCGGRWQEMDEPDGEGCLEKEGCAENAINRYFAFMNTEESYDIEELRPWSSSSTSA